MNREKVSDMLEECSELVRSGQMAERLYLDLCEQFGMRYREDNPQAFDSDDSDAAERHHLEPQQPQQPQQPPVLVPESRPAYSQQDRHVWSRREQAHQVYESRVAAAAAVAADMNRHDRLQRQQQRRQRQQPQQRQQRQGYVPVHLRLSEEDRAEREAERLARRDQRLHPPEVDHGHDQNNNNNSNIVVLQDEIDSRHEQNLGVPRLLQSSLLDPEPDTVEQMEECD
tara:strand:+ start:2216 stop:2896 length:681 start_codon:yes stop_codon:yes gene_type:complete